MYLNRLTLIGFIGGDAETKTISNGSTFTTFSLATQRSWKNLEGAWESRTEWHCVSFGKLADFGATLKKGLTCRWKANFVAANTRRTA